VFQFKSGCIPVNSESMNILSVLAGTFFTNVVGSDVFNLDADKLFNFSTSYSVNGNHIPYGPIASLDDLSASGNIQFDLYGEQLKITLKSSLKIQKSLNPYTSPSRLMKYFIGATQTTSSIIYVDGKAGKVGFAASSTTKKGLLSVSESACTHVKVPAQMYSAMATAGLSNPRLTQTLSMANQTLNRGLAAGMFTVADGVATFTKHSYYDTIVAKVKLDGTPISAAVTTKMPDYGHYQYGVTNMTYFTATLNAEFTNFVKGAGTLAALTCAEGSATSLTSNPGILHSIALADSFLEHLSDSNPAVGEFVSKFPSLSELFPEMMMEEPEPDSMPWSVMLVSFVCGGGLVLLLVKFSSPTTKLRHEPLLEEA